MIPSASRFRINVKDEAVVVTARDGGESIYTYDRAGRLFAAWVGQRFYRRGLDNRLVEKHTVRIAGIRTPIRRTLPEQERDAFLDDAAAMAAEAEDALGQGEVELLWTAKSSVSFGETLRLVATAAAYDAAAARVDAQRFSAVYRPVGILPPDQYLALVVQVTEGCHWNRCTFCTFYRDVPFRAKSVPELETHLGAVTDYLGEGLSLRHSVFLGEANALVLPTDEMAVRLELMRSWFSSNGPGPRSMYSFLDIFTGRTKSVDDYTELRQRGLRRVYVGVETGDNSLLRFLNKPQQAADAVELIRTLKAAGLSVGVIVMAGVGGIRFADSHLARTLDLLHALPLSQRDLVYLSRFVVSPHADYVKTARAYDLAPLTDREIHDQLMQFREGLRSMADNGVRISRYDIEEFLY